MNILVKDWLEMKLKDATLAVVDIALADALGELAGDDSDLVIKQISDSQCEVTTLSLLLKQGFLNDKHEKLKAQGVLSRSIESKLQSYSLRISAGNKIAQGIFLELLKKHKPNEYINRVGFTTEEREFFKSNNYH